MFSDGYEFLKAVDDRDGDAVTAMLDEPGTTIVNTRDLTSGETGLHIVTKRRDELWIRFLTQRGANPNVRDKKGVTPVQIAVTMGFSEGVERLIKAGADIEVADSAGETPLIVAVHRRDIPMIRLLLANKASPDRADNSGRTARDYAELMTANTAVLTEFERADAARESSGTQENYGPSF
ncbi:MAG: ankyrin repeat domain-containing protein [Altererythrobacter sp.]|nr:ankyrin repeat domain-containing protein [Altererythrobacter sp.]MBT8432057.1 ankyrin repeat domain-containing protein [Altererythrobacter sp.]NNE50387.1 ankyrin repeat domain-containing protein [Altererythrobacter sp.]NNF93446.1 ankyrin repeat domain-containing protein [Altererythrobacter sp.]NNK46099.1 ankyrin repeat domain-containing protein [Altererythrobacter sp.]